MIAARTACCWPTSAEAAPSASAAANCSTFATPPRDTSAKTVALCITGLLRSLLSEPVRVSFDAMVKAPLISAGQSVDTFIVLSEQQPNNHTLRARLAAAYSPTHVKLVADKPHMPRCRLATMIGHGPFGESAGVLQYFGVAAGFELIAHEERKRGVPYDWVLRMRTDMVLFRPIWLPLRTDQVYVPGGGMSFRGWTRCSNDHLFLCPRGLCAPYATLIHNFDDPTCVPLPGFAAGGDGVINGTIRAPPVRLGFQYHIPKAYNGSDRLPCGRVSELGLVYAIARARPDGMSGGLTCENNLKSMWPSHAKGLVHAALRDCAMRECGRISAGFNGGTLLNSSEMLAFERSVTRVEERLGMHKVSKAAGPGR